jgi:hypothetical protein
LTLLVAYGEAVRPLYIAALGCSVLSIVFALLTHDFFLGTKHNSVEEIEVRFVPERGSEVVRENDLDGGN